MRLYESHQNQENDKYILSTSQQHFQTTIKPLDSPNYSTTYPPKASAMFHQKRFSAASDSERRRKFWPVSISLKTFPSQARTTCTTRPFSQKKTLPRWMLGVGIWGEAAWRVPYSAVLRRSQKRRVLAA